jgi:hypothetical protein
MFSLRDHDSSTNKFHILARFGLDIEAAGESRHFGCIGEHYSLVKIDTGKVHTADVAEW